MHRAFLTMLIALIISIYPSQYENNERQEVCNLRNENTAYLITDNCLKSLSTPFTIHAKVLGSILTTPTIRNLIDCESGGNIYAVNTKDIHYLSSGEIEIGSYGVLQFSPSTFQEFCVIKYSLRDDLFDPEIQILCAEQMISEGYGGRWGCYKLVD